jgi:nucleoside-diphosphate-sugar epimerase
MATGARRTAFVTDATGFVGIELIRILAARGHEVLALADSIEAARLVRRAGAVAIMGDLRTPGRWQDEAAADWVFHLSPLAIGRGRLFRASATRSARLMTDRHLLEAIAGGPTRRIVYAADLSGHRAAGGHPVTEDEPLLPSRPGRGVDPALDRLDGYALAGLPIVTAIPGCIYGDGSWLRTLVVEPIVAGRRVLQFGRPGPLVSPIHVHDCARALVHLAEHKTATGRYFLANSEPARINEFAATVARLADRPLRVWRLPAGAARLLAGPPLARYLHSNVVFSNSRLRGIGFRFDYPTLDQGLRQVLGTARV